MIDGIQSVSKTRWEKKTGEAWLLGLILGSSVGGYSCWFLAPCSCLIGWAEEQLLSWPMVILAGKSVAVVALKANGVCVCVCVSPWVFIPKNTTFSWVLLHWELCKFKLWCFSEAFLKCITVFQLARVCKGWWRMIRSLILAINDLDVLYINIHVGHEFTAESGLTWILRLNVFSPTLTSVFTHHQSIKIDRMIKWQNSVT